MPANLSRDEVERIAALAHLALTEEEVERLARQLAIILTYAEQIRELDTTGVEPTAHVADGVAVDRADEPAAPLPRDAALANAPDASADRTLFRVPRVIA